MKLLALGLLVALPGVLVFQFQQNQYEVIHERIEVIRYNTSYVESAASHNFKYNRSHAATNLTFHFKKAFGNELVVELQSYKFASNEYRMFPIRYMYNFCEFLSKNEFGLRELLGSCGNLAQACPMKQGWYFMCNWAPISSKLPPNIPQGRYKNDVKFIYRSIEVLFLESYGSTKYPETSNIPFFHG